MMIGFSLGGPISHYALQHAIYVAGLSQELSVIDWRHITAHVRVARQKGRRYVGKISWPQILQIQETKSTYLTLASGY